MTQMNCSSLEVWARINLQKHKMAATVKKDGIRKRRFPQSSTKHALSTPYNLQWPALIDGKNKVIMDQIVRMLEPLHFKQLCTRIPAASTEDNEETKARILEEQDVRARKLEQRSSVVIGLNQVTRALEKGALKLVLVDRSIKPAILLEHLLILCATRNTPACALGGMSESAIPMLLGVRRVAAFGFKSTDTPTIFDELIGFIKEIIPPLYVPWLHPSKETSVTTPAFNPANEDDSDEERLPGIEEMHKKRKRKRIRKNKRKTGQLTAQSATANPAVNNTGQPIENTGPPTNTTGKLNLTREELLAVFGTSNSASSLQGIGTFDTKTFTEKKEKKKRRRRSKKNQGKKKVEPSVKLVYLRPCIKSFDTAPKDKGDQAK